MINFDNRKGFTLIEVILSMAIFGIIATVFITIFSSSLIWIFRAGDRGEAYTQAQVGLETRIADAEAHNDYLILNFEGKDYSIKGRIIDSTETVNQQSTQLDTFVPSMAKISLNPIYRYEGDIEPLVIATGYDTNFNNTTKVELLDSSATTKIVENITIKDYSLTEVKFKVPLNMLNGEYIVRITTKITGEPDEIARAKYIVEQPKFMIIGEENVFASANGKDWLKRSIATGWINMDPIDALVTSYNELNNGSNVKSISSNGNNYIISLQNRLLLSNENLPWTTNIKSNINDLVWVGPYFQYYAATTNGIYTSNSGKDWISKYKTTKPLNAIATIIGSDITDRVVAVGDGIILSYDGLNWKKEYDESEINFKSVTIGNNKTVALGSKGEKSVVWTYSRLESGSTWVEFTFESDQLNDVYFSYDLDRFIAVGDGGKILTSSDGQVWNNLGLIIPGSPNLNGIFSKASEVIIVGDNGTIVYHNSTDGWKVTTTGTTEKLIDVTGR